jgi:fumarylpyruvate hydrolase
MSYVFDPQSIASISVQGTADTFPVNNIYCVGRNYADHAIEMGGDPDREPPFFFMKAQFSILVSGEDMIYPALSNDVHHEVEMVVAVSQVGKDVPVDESMDLVFGYAVGIDMTRRDLPAEAKEKSRPWESGKTFVHAAPCGEIVPVSETGFIESAPISLQINGETKQQGNVNQMIWKVPEVISRLSQLFVLQPGDLIYTGTPAGVGPIHPGDHIDARIDGLPPLSFNVASQV